MANKASQSNGGQSPSPPVQQPPFGASSASCPAISNASRQHLFGQTAAVPVYGATGRHRDRRSSADDRPATDRDSLHEIIVDDAHRSQTPSTSAMLHFCKRRFLRPFVQLLGAAGLRPMSAESTECSCWTGHLQTFVVLVVLLFGYVLQFVASFRRDRGIWHPAIVQAGDRLPLHVAELLFVYVVPGVLHAAGFATALHGMRIVDNEHLQNLVERAFIQQAGQRRPSGAWRTMAALWSYVALAGVWLALMTGAIVWPELMLDSEQDSGRLLLRWPPANDGSLVAVRWLLLFAVAGHDLVQLTVITTYAIQCHLLRGHLVHLRERLLLNTIDPLDWMREMCEFRKLLHHLNKRIAAPVAWFTLMNIIYTLSGLAYALSCYGQPDDPTRGRSLAIGAGNVTLWLLLVLCPFFQAAALTLHCSAAQSSGHLVRVRPFGHHRTSAENLNAVLLYASSLRMSAKLFRMPIQGNYVCFVILCLLVVVLTLGMCLNITTPV